MKKWRGTCYDDAQDATPVSGILNPMPNELLTSHNDQEPRQESVASSLWRWLRVIIVLAMLVGLVVVARPTRIWQSLKGADYLWVLAGVPVAFAAVTLDAVKLYLLMRPHGYSGGWGSVFRTVLAVNFASLFLPGTVGGGAMAWYRLSRRDGIRAQTFTALTFNMVIKFVVVCAAGVAGLAIDAHAVGEYRALIPILTIGAVGPIVVLFLLLGTGLNTGFIALNNGALGRMLPSRIHDAVGKILESVNTYRHRSGYVGAALICGAGRRLVETFTMLFCLYALGLDMPYVRLLWILCAMEAIGMIPLPLPGVGLPQIGFVALMAAVGVSTDKGVSAEIVGKLAWLLVYLSGAGILLSESLKKTPQSTTQ